jgi:hypothetical protein
MVNTLKSTMSDTKESPSDAAERRLAPRGWLKVGTIAAASAVLGGMAAAWFYRKTLSRLREAENDIPETKSGITEGGMGEDF